MAVVTGTRYGYTDSNNIGLDISSTLDSISPFDIPLLSRIGKSSLRDGPAKAVKHEWNEHTMRPLDGAVANDSSLANTTDPVAFNVVSGQGLYLRANDILKVESELLRVTGVSTDAITVARGYGGSTAASHAASTAWAIVGGVDVQDGAVPTPRTTTNDRLYNYCQIWNDSVVVTSTQQAIKKYVTTNDLDTQVTEAVRLAWIEYERSLIHGRKVASSAGVSSAMDGILVRISTNAYAKAGATLTEAFLLQAMQDIYTAGGRPNLVVLNSFQKRVVNQFLDAQRMTNIGQRQAGTMVDSYVSDFGDVSILLDRNMPTDTVLVLDDTKIGFGPLVDHALQISPIADTTKLKHTVQIWGQYTSELRNENSHAKITGLATS